MILYLDVIVAGEQTKASMSKLFVPHVKNIIVNSVCVSMIYAIVKAKNGNLQLNIGCDIQGLYMVIITICYQSLYINIYY
jgi:hypothetical protein